MIPIRYTSENGMLFIRYTSGGRLGDFIHQLSIVYEKYLQTGRKGIVYLSEQHGSDVFTFGVQKTFQDIYPIVSTLPYIERVEIYTDQVYDYNLSSWRSTPDLYSKSWQQIFSSTYDVPWATHAWLTSPIRSDLADVTLITTSPTRWNNDIDWKRFIASLPGRVFFLRVSHSDYDHFQRYSGIELPYIDAPTFTELVIAIHSCQKFVGTLSMPLAVADALKKDRIAITQSGSLDESMAIRSDSRFVNHF
jgi:hypothetical protein